MNPYKLLNRLLSVISSSGDMALGAEGIARKYGLPNSHHLHNILMPISVFRDMHRDMVRDDLATKNKLKEIRKAVRTIEAATARIRKLEDPSFLGGSLMALQDDPYVFSAADMVSLILQPRFCGTGPVKEPAAAALAGFMKPLLEYWLESRNELRLGDAAGSENDYAPLQESPVEFLLDCLTAAGWSYSADQVTAGINAVRNSILRDFAHFHGQQGDETGPAPRSAGGR